MLLIYYCSEEEEQCLQIHVLVQLGCKVSRHLAAPVIVAVIFWYVVHIVEDETVPVQVLHCFPKANVEEHGTVKGLVTSLGERAPSREAPHKFTLCVHSRPYSGNCRAVSSRFTAQREMMCWNRQTSEINPNLNTKTAVAKIKLQKVSLARYLKKKQNNFDQSLLAAAQKSKGA